MPQHLQYRHPAQEPAQSCECVPCKVCVGLFNRDDSIAGAAYTLNGQRDTDWLECTGNNKTGGVRNDPSTFLRRCLHGDASHPAVAKGHLRYNFTSQQVVVPNIATLAGVLDAVPLDDDQARTLGVSGAPLLDLIQLKSVNKI